MRDSAARTAVGTIRCDGPKVIGVIGAHDDNDDDVVVVGAEWAEMVGYVQGLTTQGRSPVDLTFVKAIASFFVSRG